MSAACDGTTTTVGIDWPIQFEPVLAAKDAAAALRADADKFSLNSMGSRNLRLQLKPP